MNQHKFTISFAWIAALLVVTPAVAQLPGVPVFALPASADGASTFVGAEYARGLNDDSGELDAVSVTIGRSMERVSAALLGGYIASGFDEVTLGASVGVHLLSDAPVQLTLQSGIGWAAFDGITDDLTTLNFPIGLAFQGPASGGSGLQITPWVMPRLDIARISGDDLPESNTATNFAVSGGLAVTSESGFGAHVSGDVIFDNEGIDTDYPFLFSVGLHYVLGN